MTFKEWFKEYKKELLILCTPPVPSPEGFAIMTFIIGLTGGGIIFVYSLLRVLGSPHAPN